MHPSFTKEPKEQKYFITTPTNQPTRIAWMTIAALDKAIPIEQTQPENIATTQQELKLCLEQLPDELISIIIDYLQGSEIIELGEQIKKNWQLKDPLLHAVKELHNQILKGDTLTSLIKYLELYQQLLDTNLKYLSLSLNNAKQHYHDAKSSELANDLAKIVTIEPPKTWVIVLIIIICLILISAAIWFWIDTPWTDRTYFAAIPLTLFSLIISIPSIDYIIQYLKDRKLSKNIEIHVRTAMEDAKKQSLDPNSRVSINDALSENEEKTIIQQLKKNVLIYLQDDEATEKSSHLINIIWNCNQIKQTVFSMAKMINKLRGLRVTTSSCEEIKLAAITKYTDKLPSVITYFNQIADKNTFGTNFVNNFVTRIQNYIKLTTQQPKTLTTYTPKKNEITRLEFTKLYQAVIERKLWTKLIHELMTGKNSNASIHSDRTNKKEQFTPTLPPHPASARLSKEENTISDLKTVTTTSQPYSSSEMVSMSALTSITATTTAANSVVITVTESLSTTTDDSANSLIPGSSTIKPNIGFFTASQTPTTTTSSLTLPQSPTTTALANPTLEPNSQ